MCDIVINNITRRFNTLFALHTNLQYKLSRPGQYPWSRVATRQWIHIRGTVAANTDTWVFSLYIFTESYQKLPNQYILIAGAMEMSVLERKAFPDTDSLERRYFYERV